MCNSKKSLPDYLEVSKTAFVEVYSLDIAPDIAVCNSDGYFLEIKGGKIVNSLNLNKEIGSEIYCFYCCEKEKPVIFYVVQTRNQKLHLIKRWDYHLKVIEVYEGVQKYEIQDFKVIGYPQLKIFKNSNEYFIQFPMLDTEAVVDQFECETNLNSIGTLLAEKLQIVSRHVDELIEEWHSIRRLVQLNNCKENFSLIPVHSVGFSLSLEEYAEKITIISTWIKMIADKLVLGINIHYDGEKGISGLEFKMCGKLIKEYSYRFFPYDNSELYFEQNPLFSSEKINSSILPGQKITLVGAASVCFQNTLLEKKLEISCYLTSKKLKNYLVRKAFDINISDLVDFNKNFFSSLKKNCSVEDLQAIKTMKSETKFKIKINNYIKDTLETILNQNLGFKQVKYKESKLYYCRSKYLREVFIAIQSVAVTEQVWKFNFYASNESEIHFFVNILYELLPEYTTILLDED